MLLKKFLFYGNGTQGGGGMETQYFLQRYLEKMVYMGIWDLMFSFVYCILMKWRFSFFYFVECGPAGHLHKMFAAPTFPLLVPLSWINSSENQLYRTQSWASLPETLCSPASQWAAAVGPWW